MRHTTIIAVLLLAGCATATPIKTGTGQTNEYFIECDGSAIPWSKCFEKANQMCSNGYDTLEQATEHGPYTGAVAGGIASIGAAQYKHLRVRCK